MDTSDVSTHDFEVIPSHTRLQKKKTKMAHIPTTGVHLRNGQVHFYAGLFSKDEKRLVKVQHRVAKAASAWFVQN